MKVDLRSIRRALCLSQMQMALKAGVSIATIQNAESGKIRPSLSTRLKLATAYGISAEEIEAACAESKHQPAA